MQPVNRLPPEILSRIAWFVNQFAIDSKFIIPLTHVCRYWRESIVSTPGNWTSISSKRVSLAKLSLERCQAASLELWLNMDEVRRNPGFTALIMPSTQNVEALGVHRFSTVGELVQALPDFPQSMPNLRSLSLSGPSYGLEDMSADPLGQSPIALTHLLLMYLPLYPSFRRLTTLTNLTLFTDRLGLHIDTLLDLLEANRALEHATFDVQFEQPAFRDSRRQVGIANHLRSLSMHFNHIAGYNAFISRVPLQKGAHLKINLRGQNAGLGEVLSGIPVTHLSNLQSPTSMEYRPDDRVIELLGPNGSFSFYGDPRQTAPFAEFPLFQLTNIKAFRLARPALGLVAPHATLTFPPLDFPGLETLAIEREIAVPQLLSALFANPSASPSLNTLAFLDCHLDGVCMEALTKFASDRKKTTSARLYRVVIVSSRQNLPNIAPIDALVECVPVVDVRVGKTLPADLF